jgi:predicted transporter
MLYKSLILGVLFSIGIFAVKSGVGISYVAGQRKRTRDVILVVLLFALAYGLVFGIAGLILPRIDPVRHLAAVQTFIQSGMIVHLAMAGLMMGWGMLLLKQHKTNTGYPTRPIPSKAWLMLVLPCPVCITVIWLSSAFLITCFPEHPAGVVLSLYLAFVSVGLSSMGVMHRFRQRSAVSSEASLGAGMLLMAAYFLVSVTVMPQFGDLDKVYRLASYPDDAPSHGVSHLILLVSCVTLAFGAGYWNKLLKIRRLK